MCLCVHYMYVHFLVPALCHFDQEKELGIISTHNIDERGRIISGKSATCSSVSNIGNSRTHAVLYITFPYSLKRTVLI